jgi:hypothetical protein
MVNFVFTSVGFTSVGARATKPPSLGNAIKIGGVHVLADEFGNASIAGAMFGRDRRRRRDIAGIADLGRPRRKPTPLSRNACLGARMCLSQAISSRRSQSLSLTRRMATVSAETFSEPLGSTGSLLAAGPTG